MCVPCILLALSVVLSSFLPSSSPGPKVGSTCRFVDPPLSGRPTSQKKGVVCGWSGVEWGGVEWNGVGVWGWSGWGRRGVWGECGRRGGEEVEDGEDEEEEEEPTLARVQLE